MMEGKTGLIPDSDSVISDRRSCSSSSSTTGLVNQSQPPFKIFMNQSLLSFKRSGESLRSGKVMSG